MFYTPLKWFSLRVKKKKKKKKTGLRKNNILLKVKQQVPNFYGKIHEMLKPLSRIKFNIALQIKQFKNCCRDDSIDR